ncbi:MAG: hypothetical protein ACK4YF_02015 [Exilispira sp.]
MKNKIIERLEFYPVYILFFISKILPEKTLKKFLRKLSYFVLSIIRNQKNIAYKNLEIINPEYSEKEKKRIFKKFSYIYGEILSDQILFPELTVEKLKNKFKASGYEYVKKCIDDGKGCIIVLGHLGNWEIFGSHASINGIPLNGIYRPLDNKLLDKFITDFRRNFGLKLISKFSSPVSMIRPILNKEALCIVSDQNTIRNYLFVPFFGKIASASRGFSFFHLKTNCPVFFAYSIIDEKFNQYGYVEKEYDFASLYENLSYEEKHFLYLFNKTFNSNVIQQIYKENLKNFSKYYQYEKRFIKIESKEYYDEIEKFIKNIKKYDELSFDEKSFYITYFFHKSLEKIIKQYPENWFLIHPRFNKQPAGFSSVYKSKK